MGAPIFDELWREILSRRDRATWLGECAGMNGIDTSSWQGVVHWEAVAASGCEFAYIKACEGAGLSYPTLDAQYHGARAAGLTVGLYTYARPSLSPEDNADAFADQVIRLGAVAGHLPPALDLEEGAGDLSGWCTRFIARLRQRTGCRRVMVYSGSSFFAEHIRESWMDPGVVLWIAHYGRAPGHPGYLTPRVAIHQYDQHGSVPGVPGTVDRDFAIWPLSQIVDGSDDVTPDEHQMLQDIHAALPQIEALLGYMQWCYGQFAGLGPDGKPAPFPQVPGWQTFPGGTNEHLSFLDFSRRANAQLESLNDAVQAVLSAVRR